ncbi:MAG: hypothetical protein JXR07_00565 [Reichenbachiella sp.]
MTEIKRKNWTSWDKAYMTLLIVTTIVYYFTELTGRISSFDTLLGY